MHTENTLPPNEPGNKPWLSTNYSAQQRFGASLEHWTLDELLGRGYTARPISSWTDHADLIVDGPVPVLIEVKAATRRDFRSLVNGTYYHRQRYSFDVARIPKNQDLVVILIALDAAGTRHPFVVPSWLITIRDVSVIHIASEPAAYATRGRGWLAPFYQNWQTINDVANVRRRLSGRQGQYSFFGGQYV